MQKHLRKASIAELGGFEPPEDLKASWFGTVRVGRAEETWPDARGEPMTPLGQFNLEEMPYVPDRLSGIALVTVFIDAKRLPSETENGDGWWVREYRSLDDLVALEQPGQEFSIKPFPVRWRLSETEAPSWEDAESVCDAKAFSRIPDSIEVYYEKFENAENTKFGGWPALVQSELGFGVENHVFQIGTEDKAHWMWGDAGVGYFGLDEQGTWHQEWQCY
jgi:uncharacterized protein YwqG